MPLFKRIAIVGTGLIGGSMAAAIKKKHLAREVIGVSRHKSTLALAKKLKIIDKRSLNINIIKGADLVILATPVDSVIELADKIKKIVGPECIITDVGSTKAKIVAALDRIFPNYVGAHPLAGSEKRGVANISPTLFNNSLCIITPAKNTKVKIKAKITKLWKQLGARVIFMPSDKHDIILSFISHLPHIVAFSLIGFVPE